MLERTCIYFLCGVPCYYANNPANKTLEKTDSLQKACPSVHEPMHLGKSILLVTIRCSPKRDNKGKLASNQSLQLPSFTCRETARRCASSPHPMPGIGPATQTAPWEAGQTERKCYASWFMVCIDEKTCRKS